MWMLGADPTPAGGKHIPKPRTLSSKGQENQDPRDEAQRGKVGAQGSEEQKAFQSFIPLKLEF
jgi:hypothetical protein